MVVNKLAIAGCLVLMAGEAHAAALAEQIYAAAMANKPRLSLKTWIGRTVTLSGTHYGLPDDFFPPLADCELAPAPR